MENFFDLLSNKLSSALNLPNFLRKCMEISLENLYVDISGT